MASQTIVLIAFVAAVSALILTPGARWVALRLGMVDRPKERSVHTKPIPYLGGLAIFLAFSLAALLSGFAEDKQVMGILVGGAAITFFGLIDDLVQLRASVKLLGQVLAAAVPVLFFDLRITYVTNPLGGWIDLGAWGVPLTILWIVALVNVVNLVDGLDGLAAGISTIASVTLLISAIQTGQAEVAIALTAALAGSSLGFLPYNFNPAKIFMGDAGSMFLGFALAAVSVEGTLKSPVAIALAVPVLALGLPIFDTLFAIVRRYRKHQPIGQADRAHLHHRLLALGLSQRDAVLVMYLASGWLGIGALAVTSSHVLLGTMIVLFAGFTIVFLCKKIGVFDDGKGPNMNARF